MNQYCSCIVSSTMYRDAYRIAVKCIVTPLVIMIIIIIIIITTIIIVVVDTKNKLNLQINCKWFWCSVKRNHVLVWQKKTVTVGLHYNQLYSGIYLRFQAKRALFLLVYLVYSSSSFSFSKQSKVCCLPRVLD